MTAREHPTDVRGTLDGPTTLDASDKIGLVRRTFLSSAVVQIYVNGDETVSADGACNGARALLEAMQRLGWMP